MIAEIPFWQRKRLHEMTAREWESLCDGCGRCCLQKLEDEETGELFYTDLACRYLNADSCRCSVYQNGREKVENCVHLQPDDLEVFEWLPSSCAYYRLYAGLPLPSWHPLLTGDPDSVHEAGISVRGKVVSETGVPEDRWEEHIIYWVT